MELGESTKNGVVVFIRGEYFVTRTTNTKYADMLRVYVGSYWRMLFAAGDAYGDALDRCKDWIGRRRCFNK